MKKTSTKPLVKPGQKEAVMKREGTSKKEGLSLTEKQVLTLMDDAHLTDFVHFAGRYVDATPEKIREIIQKLTKDGLVEILEDHDEPHYFHTKKVTRDMIDEIIDHILKFGPKELKVRREQ
jgi:hypothetical protein